MSWFVKCNLIMSTSDNLLKFVGYKCWTFSLVDRFCVYSLYNFKLAVMSTRILHDAPSKLVCINISTGGIMLAHRGNMPTASTTARSIHEFRVSQLEIRLSWNSIPHYNRIVVWLVNWNWINHRSTLLQ